MTTSTMLSWGPQEACIKVAMLPLPSRHPWRGGLQQAASVVRGLEVPKVIQIQWVCNLYSLTINNGEQLQWLRRLRPQSC